MTSFLFWKMRWLTITKIKVRYMAANNAARGNLRERVAGWE